MSEGGIGVKVGRWGDEKKKVAYWNFMTTISEIYLKKKKKN